MGRTLEQKLREAGYRLLGITENKEELILDILKTKDPRYLKAIPFLIYSYNLDLHTIYRKTSQKEILGQIITFSREIFRRNNIIRELPHIAGKANLHFEEFKQEFELQKFNSEKPKIICK